MKTEWTYRKHTSRDYWVVDQVSPRLWICDCSDEDDAKSIVRDHNAAPDMLEALQGALAALTQNKTYPADIEAARSFISAAIAKAKGEVKQP